MALASAKQLLDELMGRDRNLTPSDKVRTSQWDLPEVCKHFLVKFCPNDLFVNTKADLGPCSKVHDDKMRKDYEKSSRFKQMGYEDDFLRFCQGMLSDVEKRIRRAKQRLALGNQDGSNNMPAAARNADDKTQFLTERINELLEQVEQLGCEGKVEEAQGFMKLCDQLKEEREAIRKANEPNHWLQQTAEIAAAQEKQMEVCEVCGAFLIVGDAQQRVDDHLMGKQHVGYAKLKAAVEEILHSREKDKEERERQREKERGDRQRQKDDEDRAREDRRKAEDERRKDKDRHREKERGRHRSGSRERRHSSPARNRSRSRRSRSRDRKHSSSSHKGHGQRSSSKERAREQLHRHNRDSRRSRSNSRSRDSKRSKRSHSNSPGTKRGRHSHRNGSPDRSYGSASPSSRRDSSIKYSSTDPLSTENGNASDSDSIQLDDQSSQ